jgi:hypothetical protein
VSRERGGWTSFSSTWRIRRASRASRLIGWV